MVVCAGGCGASGVVVGADDVSHFVMFEGGVGGAVRGFDFGLSSQAVVGVGDAGAIGFGEGF